jgi:ribosomal protein S27AE
MTCPYRYWHDIINHWICKLAFQECPEGYLYDFQFQECSTYKENEEKKMRNKSIKCPNCGKKQLNPSIAPTEGFLNHGQLNQKWYFCGKCMSYFRELFLKEKGLV